MSFSNTLPVALLPPQIRLTFADLHHLLQTHLTSGGDYMSFYSQYSSEDYFVFRGYDHEEKIVYGSLDDFFCTIKLSWKDYSKIPFRICVRRLIELLASQNIDFLHEYTIIIEKLEMTDQAIFLRVVVELCQTIAGINSRDDMYSGVFWSHEPIPKLAHLFDYNIIQDSENVVHVSSSLDEEVRTIFTKVLSPLTLIPPTLDLGQ